MLIKCMVLTNKYCNIGLKNRLSPKNTLAFIDATRILGPLCLASLGLEGIGSSSFTFNSHISHNSSCPRILGPLCLTSLGLKGIGSSSFTFDSHISHNFYLNTTLACSSMINIGLQNSFSLKN